MTPTAMARNRVVIISQSVAKQLFSGREAVDRHMQWTDSVMRFVGISYEPRRIIGVVPDIDDENIIPCMTTTADVKRPNSRHEYVSLQRPAKELFGH